jgi:hypothetical protein
MRKPIGTLCFSGATGPQQQTFAFQHQGKKDHGVRQEAQRRRERTRRSGRPRSPKKTKKAKHARAVEAEAAPADGLVEDSADDKELDAHLAGMSS